MRIRIQSLKVGLLVTLFFLIFFIPTNSAFADTKEKILNPKALFECFTVTPDTLWFYANICPDTLLADYYDSVFFYIDDCGDTGIFWEVQVDDDWVTTIPSSGYDSAPVQVFIDWLNLPDIFNPPPPGDTIFLESIIIIDPADPFYPTREVVIRLGIYCDPDNYQLLIYPSHLDITLPPNSSHDDVFFVLEAQGRELYYNYSNNSDWLHLPQSFAPLQTPDSLFYNISTHSLTPEGMAPGIYYDTIHFRAFVDNSYPPVDEKMVEVILRVDSTNLPGLVVHPTSLNYIEPIGVVFIDSFSVSAADSTDIIFLSFSNHSNWLFLPIFITPPTAPTTVQFTVSTLNLNPGIYYDEIVIIGWKSNNTPYDEVRIPVELIVDSCFQYIVRTVPQMFNMTIRPGDIFYDSLHIYEIHSANIPFTIENKLPWINVFDPLPEPPYMTPMTFIVQAIVPDIPPGLYIDTIFINPTSNADTYFPPVAVPLFISVISDKPVVKTSPEMFDFTVKSGDSLSGMSFFVYEQNELSLPFMVYVAQGDWLFLSPSILAVIPMTPDSVFFEIYTGDLPPGIYYDSFIVYYPLDDLNGFDDVYVHVRLNIIDDYIFEILTEPEALTFNIDWGDFGVDSLYVYEKLNREVPFLVQINYSYMSWLQIEPFHSYPYYTPTMLKVIAFADDTLSPGTYVDTIFITSAMDSAMFPTVAVPVTMNIRDNTPIEGDSLVVLSSTIKPCDYECSVLPVMTRLSQPIKGATIPFEIPSGVTICSLSTQGLVTESWDYSFFDINNNDGYFFAALANSFNAVIEPGETTVLNVFYKARRDCRENRTIYWDTTFTDDVSRKLVFTGIYYNTIHPGYNKYRNPTTVLGYTPGDYDNNSYPDIGDLVALVIYMFHLSPNAPPPCLLNAVDVNGDCEGPDISDLVYMVDWFFLQIMPAAHCGCINDGTPLKSSVNYDYTITTEYIDGMTEITLTNPTYIRGLNLTLTMNNNAEVVNLYDSELDLYLGQNDNITTLGLIDIDGTDAVEAGENLILQIEGEIKLLSASLSDGNYTTIRPHLGHSANLPGEYNLSQNYPNPFNPTTEISFTLAKSSQVKLEIFNIRGQKVVTLVDDRYEAGSHAVTWNSHDENGQTVSSGIYLYRIKADEWTESKKMMMLK